MIEGLKTCPQCGSGDIRIHTGYPVDYWTIQCRTCRAKILKYSRSEATEAWNRRANNDC